MPRRPPPSPRQRPARPMLIFLLATVGILFVGPASGWAQFPLPPEADRFLQNWFRLTPEERQELQKIDVPWPAELEYGRGLFLNFQQQLLRQGLEVSDSNRDARYLQELVQRIRPLMTHARRYRRIQVYVVGTPEIDARSIPGGFLLFSRGLLESAESEAALIGIVGHELAHLDRRHQLKPIQQWIRARDQLARPGQRDVREFLEAGGTMMKVFHPFHPDEEQEADQDGVRWMYQLGYDPQELARLFERLANRGARPNAVLPGFLQTHPLFPRRAEAVLEQTRGLQRENPQQNLIAGREALQQRVPDPAIGPP